MPDVQGEKNIFDWVPGIQFFDAVFDVQSAAKTEKPLGKDGSQNALNPALRVFIFRYLKYEQSEYGRGSISYYPLVINHGSIREALPQNRASTVYFY